MMVQGMMEEERTVLLMAEMMDLENPQLQLIHRQRRNLLPLCRNTRSPKHR